MPSAILIASSLAHDVIVLLAVCLLQIVTNVSLQVDAACGRGLSTAWTFNGPAWQCF